MWSKRRGEIVTHLSHGITHGVIARSLEVRTVRSDGSEAVSMALYAWTPVLAWEKLFGCPRRSGSSGGRPS